jgi:hypothetical protein
MPNGKKRLFIKIIKIKVRIYSKISAYLSAYKHFSQFKKFRLKNLLEFKFEQ